ncbi:N-alpha-acetyltransferase 80 [Galleria mellonella]|uniref:N-alpha-acetyltransferase 80 n=1 Tax=Galleria mellonella TaxID=7137 RepID=A0A6J1WJ45_GALME|nr:N-alpha-acetyltransferase 80 [Galleria mellonella]
MEFENLSVLLLHYYPEYLKQCCDLINEEWPRSETARMMSLQASCDALPTSFIIVDDKKLVIGHCKLTPIPSIPESCFVETVVIKKNLRGKRLGSYLMRYIEDYCKNVLHLKMIHLSTKGQEDFYAKLGYTVCKPVSIYGTYVPNNFIPESHSHKTDNSVPQENTPSTGAPPPPPPPMPKTGLNSNINSNIKSNKTFMYKDLIW